MKSDIQGRSTCQPGQEQYEVFQLPGNSLIDYYQYDYRTEDGKLFSCVERTLEQCRQARDVWLTKQ